MEQTGLNDVYGPKSHPHNTYVRDIAFVLSVRNLGDLPYQSEGVFDWIIAYAKTCL
jgi:hypothetical protein